MSRVLKVSQSNYRVQTTSGGTITLDTGVSLGTVIVTGDLVVNGNTTTINTTEMTVEDRVITLNSNEQGAGISLANGNRQSGIEIERGSLSTAQFVFDESVTHHNGINSANDAGTFVLKTANGQKSALQVATIVNDGASDLIFDLKASNGVLRVANTTNYFQRVVDDNDIPNWKTITNYVAAQNGVAVVDRMYFPPNAIFGDEDTKIQSFGGNIQFYVGKPGANNDQHIAATLSPTGLYVNNINLFTNTITNVSSNSLVLAANNDNVEINALIVLDDRPSVPTADPSFAVVASKTKIWSGDVSGPGKTGIYFRNITTTDELISKNRAVLLSILL